MTASHAFHRSGTYKTGKNETKTKGNKIDRSSNKTDEMQIAKKNLYTVGCTYKWLYFFAAFSKTVLSSFKLVNSREQVVFVDNFLYTMKLPLQGKLNRNGYNL